MCIYVFQTNKRPCRNGIVSLCQLIEVLYLFVSTLSMFFLHCSISCIAQHFSCSSSKHPVDKHKNEWCQASLLWLLLCSYTAFVPSALLHRCWTRWLSSVLFNILSRWSPFLFYCLDSPTMLTIQSTYGDYNTCWRIQSSWSTSQELRLSSLTCCMSTTLLRLAYSCWLDKVYWSLPFHPNKVPTNEGGDEVAALGSCFGLFHWEKKENSQRPDRHPTCVRPCYSPLLPPVILRTWSASDLLDFVRLFTCAFLTLFCVTFVRRFGKIQRLSKDW